MMIRVIYTNGAYDIIKPSLLDEMLESGAVAGFLRKEGWAVIGRDPVRKRSRQPYEGAERREYARIPYESRPSLN